MSSATINWHEGPVLPGTRHEYSQVWARRGWSVPGVGTQGKGAQHGQGKEQGADDKLSGSTKGMREHY